MAIAKPRPRQNRLPMLFEPLESRLLLSYTYSVLGTLHGRTTGNQPNGLVMDADGNLFGITASGGAKGYGAIFEIAASSNTVTTLVSFTGANGISPRGNLVLDAQGNLFGTTIGGGAFKKGTIFEVAAGTTSTITTLASFNGVNGAYPFAGLVMDADGNLFGTTLGASGASFKSTVFELATGSSAITVLATFKSSARLNGTLAIDSAGNLFGATGGGGTASRGTLFEIDGSAHTLTTLVSFKATNGSTPSGQLLLDDSGDLIGSTYVGGTSGAGTLFSFNLNASVPTITTLATFNLTNGNHPIGNLILDGDGNIFGVTSNGGAHGSGTAFELPAGTASTLTTLYSFRGQGTGTNPTGPLIMDSQGNFYGTTYAGGPSNSGMVFELHNDDVVFSPPPVPEIQFAGASLSSSPARLVVTQGPQTVPSGQAFSLTIALENASGQVVDADAALTLTLVSGPKGGKLGGTVNVSFVDGLAVLSGLTLKGNGTYTLEASADALSLNLVVGVVT